MVRTKEARGGGEQLQPLSSPMYCSLNSAYKRARQQRASLPNASAISTNVEKPRLISTTYQIRQPPYILYQWSNLDSKTCIQVIESIFTIFLTLVTTAAILEENGLPQSPESFSDLTSHIVYTKPSYELPLVKCSFFFLFVPQPLYYQHVVEIRLGNSISKGEDQIHPIYK